MDLSLSKRLSITAELMGMLRQTLVLASRRPVPENFDEVMQEKFTPQALNLQ